MACAAPGVTPVDGSEKGAPVCELIWPSVLGEYAIQATASVWMPFEQVHDVVSGDVDVDSFGMAPWDAGGMHSRTRSEAIRDYDATVVNAAVVPTSDHTRTWT